MHQKTDVLAQSPVAKGHLWWT